ncbi:MAG TPA: DinB family protein [Candidatus Solibacter sp.]|nr:DinB family protein [Candidatus Solibacter sp.]
MTRPGQALTELLRGKGAHADPVACVEDISCDLASKQVAGFPHSIAQLLFHINYWMDYELRRMRGARPKYPEHNAESFPPVPVVDPQEWERLRSQFSHLLAEYAALAQASWTELDRQVESSHDGDTKVAGTVEAVLWQMVAHTSYHVGQIAFLRRALGVWPPRAGGDSW